MAGATHLGDHQLFTPVFTPARFLAPFRARDFQQVTVPQARMQFTADCCPLYPQKRTIRHRALSVSCTSQALTAGPRAAFLSPTKLVKIEGCDLNPNTAATI
jgi:hypothetical protein